MADNIELSSGSGGATVKTDDDGTAHWQYVKAAYGADNTQTRVTAANGLPVQNDSSNTFTVSLSATDNAVLDSIDTAVNGTVTVDLGANNDVTIDGSSIVLAEDAAHNTGDAGIQALAVRNDSLAALAGTDGDYAPLQVDADGSLYASMYNKVDSGNSSTSPLTGGATFTGTGVDVSAARNVNVSVFADQASATDGLKIQFSSDNSNWDFEEDFTISANTGETHTVPVMAQYARVVYENGASAQSAFRLQTILVTDDLTGTVAPLDTTVGSGNQAVLTRSVLSAFNGSSYSNVTSTAGGNLKISLQEASDGMDIGAGNAGGETLRVAIATDDVNLSTLSGAVSGSEMQVDVVGALPTGSNLVGDVGLSGARTSGGTTTYKNLDVDESEDEVKGTAGQLYWIHAMNLGSSVRYLKIYNAAAASVTVGTTTPVHTFPIPTQGDSNGAGFSLSVPNGIALDTGITIAATTGVADNDTGAPGANEVVVNLGYA